MAKLAGNSGKITVQTAAGPKNLKSYGLEQEGGPRAKVLWVRPDAGNTATVLVGPNDAPFWPMLKADNPQPWECVDPAHFSIDSQGNSGQVLYYTYGGEAPQDSGDAPRFPKRFLSGEKEPE